MADLRYRTIDHPSDTGIVAFGSTLEEIFENAAFGLFSLMADLDKVSVREGVGIKVKAGDREELLVNWLNELIYYQDAKKMLFKDFKIKTLTATRLEATASGERIDPARHTLYKSIKAATYNQLKIGPGEARIVFDV